MSPLGKLIAFSIISLIGFGMLVGAYLLSSSTRSFLKSAVSANGEVIDLIKQESHTSRGKRRTTYAPVVRFSAADGRVVEFQSSIASDPPAYSRGDRLSVLYEPGTPENARIDSFFSLWGAAVIVGGIGAVFLLIGCAPLLVLLFALLLSFSGGRAGGTGPMPPPLPRK